MRASNALLNSAVPPRALLLLACGRYLTRTLGCLGLAVASSEPCVGFAEPHAGAQGSEQALAPVLDALTAFRDSIRTLARGGAPASQLLAACDALRDVTLPPLGVRVDDKAAAGASRWKLVSPEELRVEAERERECARLKEEAKAEAQRRKAEKEERARAALAVPPEVLFRGEEYEGQFGGFDERGFPTVAADGQPLSKSLLKKLQKLYDARCAAFAAAAGDGAAAQLSEVHIAASGA